MLFLKYFNYFRYAAALICVLLMSPAHASEDWVAEEIFKQINELRRDNNQLRKDMGQLKQELTQLKSAKGKNKLISKVSLDDDPSMGKVDAKVAIIEFTDYECPFCKRHIKQTLPKLKANYIDTGKIKYVLRDFPLSFHKQAKSAAIAANCAGEQGSYWPMHEQLFEKRSSLNTKGFMKMAKGLSLDTKKFSECMDDPAQAKEVDSDLKYGEQAGVRGTPAFFIGKLKDGHVINARFISGAQSYSRFSSVLDAMLN